MGVCVCVCVQEADMVEVKLISLEKKATTRMLCSFSSSSSSSSLLLSATGLCFSFSGLRWPLVCSRVFTCVYSAASSQGGGSNKATCCPVDVLFPSSTFSASSLFPLCDPSLHSAFSCCLWFCFSSFFLHLLPPIVDLIFLPMTALLPFLLNLHSVCLFLLFLSSGLFTQQWKRCICRKPQGRADSQLLLHFLNYIK